MPEDVINKRERERYDELNDNHKSNSHEQHNNTTLLSRIAVPVLFAALIGTTGGTIALASMVGEFFTLFPSAEAAKKIPTCDGLTATIVGKEKKNDVLQGTEGTDVIVGLSGNDQIFGNGGNDHMCGGTGDDHIEGGTGNDKLFGEEQVVGGTGNDILIGDDGNDELVGGAGNDGLGGDAGDDFLIGNDGNDRLFGDAGDDILLGDAGDDELGSVDGVVDNDELNGGSEINADICNSDPDPEVNCEI